MNFSQCFFATHLQPNFFANATLINHNASAMQNPCKVGNDVVFQTGFVATDSWGKFFCAMPVCCFALVHRLFCTLQKVVATCATLTAVGKAQMAFLPMGGRGALVCWQQLTS